MPNTPLETGDADAAKFLPHDSLKPPEHISMQDLSYVNYLINNAITPIRISIDYEYDPDIRKELESTKTTLVGRIDFLLTHYKEDLKNMPEVQNFLELLRYLIEQDQLQHAVNLQQLAARAFKMEGTLSKPGRHLSQEMTKVTEGQEAVPELKLTVINHCNNQAGRYVGLNKTQRDLLGVDVGGTVELFDEKGTSLGLFTVGAGSKEYTEEPEIFTVTPQVKIGDTLIVKKPSVSPDKLQRFNLQVTHAVEKTAEPEKHRGRVDKIIQRFPHYVDPNMYITLPTAVAAQLGIKPEPGKTVAPISECIVRPPSGWDKHIAIVPSGTGIGFTSEAAEELDIPAELTEIRIIIDKGVLVIG